MLRTVGSNTKSRTWRDLAEFVEEVTKPFRESCREWLVVLPVDSLRAGSHVLRRQVYGDKNCRQPPRLVYSAIATLKAGVHHRQEKQLDAHQLSEKLVHERSFMFGARRSQLCNKSGLQR